MAPPLPATAAEDGALERPHHGVVFSAATPELSLDWDGPVWGGIPWLEIACFREEGSAHRPRTRLKLLYGDAGLSGLFRVEDRFVRAVRNGFQAEVYKDSCVECFLQPRPDAGYFNFEWNCGGSLLASYITDPARRPGGFRAWTPLAPEDGWTVLAASSLPALVDPEIEDPVTWRLAFFIPFALLARFAGPLGEIPDQRWRANFYKCGDETSHPHWGAWSAVTERNFHMPQCFGELRFEKKEPRS